MPASSQPWIILGNLENRRVEFFQQALTSFSLPPAQTIAYTDFLAGEPLSLPEHSIVRIESPGENFDVEKRLLAAGLEDAQREGSPTIEGRQLQDLEFDRGLILHPRQWYLGFRRVLTELAARLPAGSRWMNDPQDIACMFDKPACYRRFAEAGIPTPESLGAIGGYEELIARMEETGMRRVFLKLAHGSSASGVVAFRWSPTHQQAITTAELVRSGGEVRLYNSLKLRTYTSTRDLADVIAALCRQRVHVDRWIPKAAIDDERLDLRIVVIAGRARHVVVRQSRGPITNLHLGNRRGDWEEVKRRLGDQWLTIEETCRRVAALFPRSLYAGVDIAVEADFRRHVVLEANAFGDLLPGVECDGLNTYAAEVQAMLDD